MPGIGLERNRPRERYTRLRRMCPGARGWSGGRAGKEGVCGRDTHFEHVTKVCDSIRCERSTWRNPLISSSEVAERLRWMYTVRRYRSGGTPAAMRAIAAATSVVEPRCNELIAASAAARDAASSTERLVLAHRSHWETAAARASSAPRLADQSPSSTTSQA